MARFQTVVAWGMLVLCWGSLCPAQPETVRIDSPLPYGSPPVRYHQTPANDRITLLQSTNDLLDLGWDLFVPQQSLAELLQMLEIPVESQSLVFSKTARTPHLISPKTPRAIYFSDDVYVASIPGAESLEITSLDPQLGAIFSLRPQPGFGEQRFQRENRCLTCHVSRNTLSIPGLMLRSFLTDRGGRPKSGYSQVTHAMPFSQRWGGWYVTGSGADKHLGNVMLRGNRPPPGTELSHPLTKLDSLFDVDQYLTPHSDQVAQLVLNHQVHGQNLLIRAGYEHRLGVRSDVESQLLRYLFFLDEARLNGPVNGTSGFDKRFPLQGRKDSQGRSLRDFDLKTRIFRYRLSYLVETRLFTGLPHEVKQRLYRQFWLVLQGTHPDPDFQQLPAEEREAILQILRETHPDLPESWQNL